MTTCPYCTPAVTCVADAWREVLWRIIVEVEEDFNILDDESADSAGGPPLVGNNVRRKEVYRRFAVARGFVGRRYKLEECVVGDIRDAFPRRACEPAYMGHRES